MPSVHKARPAEQVVKGTAKGLASKPDDERIAGTVQVATPVSGDSQAMRNATPDLSRVLYHGDDDKDEKRRPAKHEPEHCQEESDGDFSFKFHGGPSGLSSDCCAHASGVTFHGFVNPGISTAHDCYGQNKADQSDEKDVERVRSCLGEPGPTLKSRPVVMISTPTENRSDGDGKGGYPTPSNHQRRLLPCHELLHWLRNREVSVNADERVGENRVS